jgi:hypothetical protein
MESNQRLFTFEDVKTMAGYRPTPYDDEEWGRFVAELDRRNELSRLDGDLVQAAAKTLNKLGIEAEAPDQSGNISGFQNRLVLNIRGICIDEFSDWVSIELRHLDPNSEWYEGRENNGDEE